jgi:nucleoside-triphosphatase THEP1
MNKVSPRILITGVPGVGKTTLVRKVVEKLDVPLRGFYTEEIREQGKRVGFKLRTIEGKEGVLAHIHSTSRFRVGKYGVEVRAFEEIAVPELERALQLSSPLQSRGEKKGGVPLVIPAKAGIQVFPPLERVDIKGNDPPFVPPYCRSGGDSPSPLQSRGEKKGGIRRVIPAKAGIQPFILVMDELGRMELFSKKFQQKVMEVFDSSVPILAVIQDRRNPFLDAIRGRKDVMLYRVTEENREGLVGEIVGKLESVKV